MVHLLWVQLRNMETFFICTLSHYMNHLQILNNQVIYEYAFILFLTTSSDITL